MEKVTKIQRIKDIKALLTDRNPVWGTSLQEALDFLDKEIASIEKKNAYKSEKDKQEQEANEEFRGMILAILPTYPAGMTATEIRNSIPSFKTFSTQRVTSLLNTCGNRVTKSYKGKKTLFSIPI